MIASKPYVFPPRIVFTGLKIVRVLIIIVSLFLKTDIVICAVQYSEEVQRMITPEREPCVINYFHS